MTVHGFSSVVMAARRPQALALRATPAGLRGLTAAHGHNRSQ
jgi:hypothetical protein